MAASLLSVSNLGCRARLSAKPGEDELCGLYQLIQAMTLTVQRFARNGREGGLKEYKIPLVRGRTVGNA